MRSSQTPVLLALALAAATTTCLFAAGGEPPRHWSFQLEMTGRHDDNVTELSDTDRERVNDPACNADPLCANRFRIESPDDFVLTPSARAEWSKKSAGARETSLRAEVRLSRYARNSVKDYEAYGVRFSQDLTSSSKHATAVVVRASVIPDYYLRELAVPEESRIQGQTVRDSAQFSSVESSASLQQVLVPKYLDLELMVERDQRDYDAPFDERDGDLAGYGVNLVWNPAGTRTIDLRIGYRRASFDARGDRAATLALEPDTSSDRDTASCGLSLGWGRKGRRGGLLLGVEHETRNFLSNDPADSYYVGREDTRTQLSLAARQALARSLYLEAELSRETNDSKLGPDASAASGDDVTDYGRNLASVSIGWRF